MAKFDFRALLRKIGGEALDATIARLLSGTAVRGGIVAPLKVEAGTAKTIRTRLKGLRFSLQKGRTTPGVETGDMLRQMNRRGNVRVTRTGFRILPPKAIQTKWFVFNVGRRRHGNQPARPVSGLTDAQIRAASEEIARDGREQLVRQANEAIARQRSGR